MSILILEKRQLMRLSKCLCYGENDRRNKERIRLAVKLIDLLQDDFPPSRYVNIRNCGRFGLKINTDSEYLMARLKDSLYLRKIWNLYNKLRYYHMQEWWD